MCDGTGGVKAGLVSVARMDECMSLLLGLRAVCLCRRPVGHDTSAAARGHWQSGTATSRIGTAAPGHRCTGAATRSQGALVLAIQWAAGRLSWAARSGCHQRRPLPMNTRQGPRTAPQPYRAVRRPGSAAVCSHALASLRMRAGPHAPRPQRQPGGGDSGGGRNKEVAALGRQEKG